MTTAAEFPLRPDWGFRIAADDLPGPGEDFLFEVEGSPYTVLIAHNGEPQAEVDEPSDDDVSDDHGPTTWYEVVDVRGATRTHAALVRRRGNRSVVNRWTLCSVSNSRRVTGRKRDLQLSTVTCAQCRRRLEAEGEL